MSAVKNTVKQNHPPVLLDAKDLPAYCPHVNMPLWSSHPRVFLEIDDHGSAKCPYCGTDYQIKPGVLVKAH